MHKKLLLLVLCALVFRATAQNVPAPQPATLQPETPEAQLKLGNDYLDKKDYASAMTWFRQAAERRNPAAQTNIGWLYQNGFGVKQDYTEAMNWYRKAANQGNAPAQNNIGWLYQHGWGVKQDYSEAANWYSTAAEQGNVKSQVRLGSLFQRGLGVEQSYLEAMAWYSRAAENGDSEAQNEIGDLYRQGLGVTQDYAKAMTWYRKAADQGYGQAESNIASLYAHGLGVPQDQAEADAWSKKASEHILMPGGIRPPHVIYSPDPEYSKKALKAKFQGTCVLWLIVGADGNPRDIKVERPLGKGLDEKAIEAVKKWRFEPGTKDGAPVATQIEVEVTFRLY